MMTLRVRYCYVHIVSVTRDVMITLILLVRVTYTWCYSSRTSRLWWITHTTQRHQRGCNNIPSFLQWTTPIAHSFCEGFTQHDLHILVKAVQHHFVAIGKPELHVRKASQCGSKQQ